MVRQFFISLSMVVFGAYIYPVVILVHGTFASDVAWCKPGGDFYEELTKAAQKINQKVVPFTWSGKLNDQARFSAARSLVQLIQSYPALEHIILVGHSHGGNVINFATYVLFDPTSAIGNCGGSYDSDEMAQFINQVIMHLNACKSNGQKNKYLIDEVYLLATPVEQGIYAPCTQIVERVYNIYSRGDFVQKVGGLYKRKYQNIERVINVCLKIPQCGLFGGSDPSHTQMHAPVVAKNLLLLKHLGISADGILWIAQNRIPVYEIPRGRGEILPMHQDQLSTVIKA